MNVFINEVEIDKKQLSVNTGLNFGRFDFEGLLIDDFKIVLTEQEFKDCIEPEYNSIRDEIKKDDQIQNDSSAFTAIDYGSISKLLQSNNDLIHEIVTTYLDRILYDKLFTKSGKGSFIINSTDVVMVNNNMVEISGRTYRNL